MPPPRVAAGKVGMKHPTALLGVLLICAIPAVAQKAELPPLVEPPNAEHHVGKVIWADLTTPDLAVAKRFYSGLFGWTFRDIHFGKADYAVASLNGRPVGGFVQRLVPSGEQRRPAWLGFIAVRDVDAAKRTAVEHGAKVVFEPKTYAQRGRQAVFTDPEGAVFAVLASSSGDPGDFLAMPGEWIWSSLHAQDPDKDAAFYQTLFGYDVFDLQSDDGLDHVILSTDDYARASVNAFPRDSARRHSHWLNFVRVVDAAEVAAKAVALGGRVLVEPHVDRHGGKVAVVADPAGALFGLMEWTDTDSKKEPK
jgi:predicted enzyme related to lactoylglutathione lyase